MDITTICTTITDVLNSAKTPATALPPVLLALGGQFRSGISPTMVAANIIRRQSEAGAPFGDAADGTPSIAEKMEIIRVEEIFKAIKLGAQVQTSISPGMLNIVGTCATPSGPGTIMGTNATPINAFGIIQ